MEVGYNQYGREMLMVCMGEIMTICVGEIMMYVSGV